MTQCFAALHWDECRAQLMCRECGWRRSVEEMHDRPELRDVGPSHPREIRSIARGSAPALPASVE